MGAKTDINVGHMMGENSKHLFLFLRKFCVGNKVVDNFNFTIKISWECQVLELTVYVLENNTCCRQILGLTLLCIAYASEYDREGKGVFGLNICIKLRFNFHWASFIVLG